MSKCPLVGGRENVLLSRWIWYDVQRVHRAISRWGFLKGLRTGPVLTEPLFIKYSYILFIITISIILFAYNIFIKILKLRVKTAFLERRALLKSHVVSFHINSAQQ